MIARLRSTRAQTPLSPIILNVMYRTARVSLWGQSNYSLRNPKEKGVTGILYSIYLCEFLLTLLPVTGLKSALEMDYVHDKARDQTEQINLVLTTAEDFGRSQWHHLCRSGHIYELYKRRRTFARSQRTSDQYFGSVMVMLSMRIRMRIHIKQFTSMWIRTRILV